MGDKIENAKQIKERRERALKEHKQRAQEITKWVKEHGGVHRSVSPYETDATPEAVNELILAIQKELESGRREDAHILLNVMSYLQKYDFTTVDEAGYDTPGFCLALSEVGVALRHLRNNPENAMRYLLYRYKLKTFANRFALLEFPPILYLEASLLCNLTCIMCYQSSARLQKKIKENPEKMMKWELFTKIIDEAVARNCYAVVFAGKGEPTLNPRFSDMLKYCHQKGILDIKLNTNAMTLTPEKVRAWLSLNALLTIVFSVDAGNKEVFEKIRIGSNFDKIVANIQMFNKIRSEEFPDSPVRTRVNMVLFQPDQDPEEARALWAPMVDEFSARNANIEQAGSIYQYDPNDPTPNVAPDKICNVFFNRIHIWSDGTVNPCENDYESYLCVGNVKNESLHDIWNGPKMMKLRVAHMTKRKNTCYPCNNCTGY